MVVRNVFVLFLSWGCVVAGCSGEVPEAEDGGRLDSSVGLPDASIDGDAGEDADGGGDAGADASLTDVGVAPDGGLSHFDGGPSNDAGHRDAGSSSGTDAGTNVDAGADTDAGAGPDGGAAFDGGSASDSGVESDGGTGADAGTNVDAGAGFDAGTNVDAGAGFDAGTNVDAGSNLDAGANVDAGSNLDAGAGCLSVAECPPAPSACASYICAGQCMLVNQPDGTPTSDAIPGDCMTLVCDGAGGTRAVVDDADVPVDGLVCTDDVCSSGVASNPAWPVGSVCGATNEICHHDVRCAQCTVAAFTGSGRLEAPADAAWNPAGDLTIEAWIAPRTITWTAPRRVIVAHNGLPSAFDVSFSVALDGSGRLVAGVSRFGSTFAEYTHPTPLPTNDFHHVAVVFNALQQELTLFLDGVPGQVWFTGVPEIRATNQELTIGDNHPDLPSAPFTGVIADVRLSSVARYSAAFTPVSYLTSDGDTLAHFPLDDPPLSTAAVDRGPSALDASVASPQVAFTPGGCR